MVMYSLWLLLMLVLFAAAVTALLLSRIRTEIFVSRFRFNDRITVDVRALFGLFRYRIYVPLIDFNSWLEGFTIKKKADASAKASAEGSMKLDLTRERIMSTYERYKLLLKNVYNLKEWTKASLKRLECTYFMWNTRIGVGDAPETAIATGLVWGVKSSLLGMGFGLIRLKTRPNIQVSPQYNMQTFTTELMCKLQIRLVHVLWAGLRLFPHIWKGKGDWESWQHILFPPRLKSTS